ncbi:MAG TPA: L,D-transpeptidase family protein [Chthoniobacterales bacterium]
MKRTWIFLGLATGAAALLAWLFWPAPRAQPLTGVDRILVEKGRRQLSLLRGGEVLKTYRVVLGKSPIGHKTQEGDQKTPEGVYEIDGRNPQSAFHLSLRISYPSAADRAQAEARGVSPGCDIMIHGLPNGAADPAAPRWREDWTAGCIAVSDAEIREIWAAVPDGTAVEIRP